MQYKNSARQYGLVAKLLHWITALLFLAAYMSVYFRHWFSESNTPENWWLLQLHLSIGVSIGVLVILRIIWRLMNPSPVAEPGTPTEHFAARMGHLALYAIMIIMPLTGYLGTGANTEFFFLFDITKFSDTWLFTQIIQENLGISFKYFEAPVDFIHKKILGEWLVWMLIMGHIIAGLYHHFVKKDRTLKKITFESAKS